MLTQRLWWMVWVVVMWLGGPMQAAWIWVEGEQPVEQRMNRHPWYDQVNRQQFSGADFISNFNKDKAGEAEYRFQADEAGVYEFWVRANPLSARLSYSLNGQEERPIELEREKRGDLNVAADGKADLRFLAWSRVGKVKLAQGANTIRFRMSSANSNHGYLDCFVFSTAAFQPRGSLKPDQLAAQAATLAGENAAWLPFDPPSDAFATSPIDLRFLNENSAGENGFIGVKNGEFVHTDTGKPVRFWAVNGPPSRLSGEELRICARMLAKRGVNLIRIHGGYFNDDGEVNLEKVRHTFEIVDAMKGEGIYSHLSIYFPLWIRPKADAAWLKGYDGTKHPFAALFFNPDFQAKYRTWWTALLTTRTPSGKTLAQESAVAAVEIQNEDSFFFWTFSEQNLPDPQLRILESMFADWLKRKHGSLEAAFQRWNNLRVKRDAPAEGRVGFRPLWNLFNEKKPRDQDTTAFLLEVQSRFYSDTYAFLRKLGFKGLITASNWSTASPEVFGPLEKWSYTTCDFIDRHGYFGCFHKGDSAEWSIRNGHTYADRSAYRFDPEQPGKPKVFVHPAMDVHYNGKPSMISETTWTRPNRFRSESPIYLAAYGALQHTDAIVHFALDGAQWNVKPGFWMQPWTLMSPSLMGQFPAAALVYRKGLVSPGAVLANVTLNTNDLLALKGTPLPQEAALDELRLKDVPSGTELKPGQRIDPLIHYAGRTEVRFSGEKTSARLTDLKPLVDHTAQTVTSSTGELKLDYAKGVLLLNAPAAQGVSGMLAANRNYETRDLTIVSDMQLGHIIAVPLDDAPLAISRKILLQVMSEEKTSGFTTESAGENTHRIVDIGTAPWLFKELKGEVKLKRADAAQLKVTALDLNGYPAENAGPASGLKLRRGTVYYLISKE